MTAETVTIEVVRYRGPNGKPTCSAKWGEQDCPRLLARRFGLQPVCGSTLSDLGRDEGGRGFIRPAAGCVVWTDAEREA